MMYTQVPNHYIDEVMRHLSPSATVCYIYICRQTLGWQKEIDTISISQFEQSTGLTKPTVLKALRELADCGAITIVPQGQKREYKIATSIKLERTCCDATQAVLFEGPAGKKSLPQKDLTGQKSLPEPVKNLDPQKKGKKDNRLSDWQFTVYRELTHLTVPHAFRDQVETITDEAVWKEVITRWIGRGYRINNIAGMIEWYNKEMTDGRTKRQNNGGNEKSVEQYLAANRKWSESL